MEGPDGGGGILNRGERYAVVDDLEDAPVSRCGADEIDSDGAWDGEIHCRN